MENSEQWQRFDQDITNTLRAANAMIDDKKMALRAAANKERSLRAECEIIVLENDRLMVRQSENVAIHRELTKRLDDDLKSMTANCDELER